MNPSCPLQLVQWVDLCPSLADTATDGPHLPLANAAPGAVVVAAPVSPGGEEKQTWYHSRPCYSERDTPLALHILRPKKAAGG